MFLINPHFVTTISSLLQVLRILEIKKTNNSLKSFCGNTWTTEVPNQLDFTRFRLVICFWYFCTWLAEGQTVWSLFAFPSNRNTKLLFWERFWKRDQLFLFFNCCHKDSFPSAQFPQQRTGRKLLRWLTGKKQRCAKVRHGLFYKRALLFCLLSCRDAVGEHGCEHILLLRTVTATALEIKKKYLCLWAVQTTAPSSCVLQQGGV